MKIREPLLAAIVGFAAKRRILVYVSTVVLTILLAVLSAGLKLDVRWSTLLPKSLPVVQQFEKIDHNYLQPGNMIIAISGPDAVELERLTDEVTAILEQELVCPPERSVESCKPDERYARYVYGKQPEAWLTEHALRLAKPKDARRLATILADPRLVPYLTHLNDDLEAEFTDAEDVKNQERQVVASLDALEGLVLALNGARDKAVDPNRVERVVRDLTVGRPYLLSLDKTMSLVMVASAVSTDDIETMPLLDKRIEVLLRDLAGQNPAYRFERTGLTAIGRDEMESVGPQTQMITLLALFLVFVLLCWNFRSLLTPLLALAPIVVGIIWALGIIAVTLGMLNLLTVMVMVVLLGLGIDFTIHICNRFSEETARGKTIELALRDAIMGTGTGVSTGAVTTAVAFFALAFADTKGIREFGIAAGIGVLTTLAATLWLLPALLASVEGLRQKLGWQPRSTPDFSALGGLAVGMARWRVTVVGLALLALGCGGLALSHLQWEWNFLELEPEGLRSVELQDEIIDKYKLSVSLSMLTADSVEQSRALREKLKKKRVVGDVDDISLWVSRPDLDRSLPHIEKLRAALDEIRPGLDFSNPGQQAALAEQLDRLWANLVEIQALSFTAGQDRVVEKTQQLVANRKNRPEGLLKKVATAYAAGKGIDWRHVQAFGETFADVLQEKGKKMTAGQTPVTLTMVPPKILARYVSATADGYLMQFFPKDNLYERDKLETFQASVTSVHEAVTGTPQMILNMCLETMREGKIAVIISLLVILAVLLLDFRRPLIAILTFMPLVVGMALTFIVMWAFGEKFNYVNMIALPVIVGIGVDDGVHFFHRYLQEGRGGMRRAVTSVGRAILMTSLTTMIGFGSLMLYLMRGMASMGFVLFVGVGMCFLVTVTLLPALAGIFEKRLLKESQI